MDPNDKKISVFDMEVEAVTITDPKFWKWADQRLDATLGTIPTRSIVTRRSGTSQIDQSFWGNLTRVMGISIGEMLQSQQSQQQPTVTPIAQAGCREFYSDCTLAALMGYAQFYTEAYIPKIWGGVQMSNGCDDNCQLLLAGMMYWSKTNFIKIDTAVFFVKLSI